MDTDSSYMALTADSLEEIVRPGARAEFETKKKEWLAWDKWSERTPGLIKLESYSCFVIFHLFGHTSHKLAPMVDLQKLRLLQRAALVNRLETFCNFRRVF